VESVRQGKVFEIELGETDPEAARAALDAMSAKLLANPVMENWRIEVQP
jgi:phosphoribosylformylglycinamidine synthase